MRLAKRGIQNEVMGEVFLQDQGGVGGFFSLKVFSFKYRLFFLQITLLYWQCQCAYKIKRGAVGNSF
jgi:hypothetical protein